jgi:hypothetical protein
VPVCLTMLDLAERSEASKYIEAPSSRESAVGHDGRGSYESRCLCFASHAAGRSHRDHSIDSMAFLDPIAFREPFLPAMESN